MFKKITYIFVILLLAGRVFILSAQQVVTTSGGEGTIDGINLQWTLGECVVATTVVQNNVQITQGFQQPAYLIEPIENDLTEITGFSGKLEVFPVPAKDYLTIRYETEEQVNYVAILTDINGKTILREELAGSENHIDMQKFLAGIYVLTISDSKGKFLKSFKITKQ